MQPIMWNVTLTTRSALVARVRRAESEMCKSPTSFLSSIEPDASLEGGKEEKKAGEGGIQAHIFISHPQDDSCLYEAPIKKY